jgi:peroxiredoxin
MSINVGDNIPSVTLSIMGANGPEAVTTDSLFADKKGVLFAVPSAFTPGCSMHLHFGE